MACAVSSFVLALERRSVFGVRPRFCDRLTEGPTGIFPFRRCYRDSPDCTKAAALLTPTPFLSNDDAFGREDRISRRSQITSYRRMDQALQPQSAARTGSSEASSNASASEASPEQTHVFLVDDHPAIREALRSAVRGRMGMQVVGDRARAAEALSPIERHAPDVVVVDVSLEDTDGLTFIRRIRSRAPEPRILVFSMHDEEVYAERAIRAGASGYVMKTEPTETVIRAIEEVSEGQVYLSQHITSRILSKVIRTEDYSAASQFGELTDRELTVFRTLGEGYSVREIADRLDLNRKTIETYRRRAKEKLGYDTVEELLQHAVQWRSGHGEPGRLDDVG